MSIAFIYSLLPYVTGSSGDRWLTSYTRRRQQYSVGCHVAIGSSPCPRSRRGSCNYPRSDFDSDTREISLVLCETAHRRCVGLGRRGIYTLLRPSDTLGVYAEKSRTAPMWRRIQSRHPQV
ncbi:hypothetical protein F5Y01DRAFT_52336 [Xylaria sp. FL0043]|nr:hypothetical protein F5Y01DRAFT_52336 [Xylaria sp. FL0043]